MRTSYSTAASRAIATGQKKARAEIGIICLNDGCEKKVSSVSGQDDRMLGPGGNLCRPVSAIVTDMRISYRSFVAACALMMALSVPASAQTEDSSWNAEVSVGWDIGLSGDFLAAAI